ncbi:porin family protein [Mucilaginibacter myungsuensis]|uniref:PorT family protein n=1 Tax=Mucilaginibacter myungsuensis TaxID=649104 RepID=A0A929KWA8_9SPHI|nr:porin family protein [Mucilaginibacter myungsuensis]MBE9662352.1 PorT family protein [Mucilaginibacter myungsuensis]MDN3599211.1 porin family protein [Mucilaginibacter myungsuensis]
MKKSTLFLAIALLTSISAIAQRRYPAPRRYPASSQRRVNDDYNKVKFGIVGGVNLSNVVDVNDSRFDTDTKAGLNIGLSLDVPIIKPLSFEGEVLYSQKGYRAATIDGDFTQRNHFIDVPLLAKLKLAPQFNVVVGPQISFLMSTQNIYRNGFTTIREDVYTRDADGYNKALIGGVVGVGIDLSPNVELRGRYTLDLQSTNRDRVTYVPQYRNQVFQIGLGFKFF